MDDWTPVFMNVYDPLKAGSIDATDTEPHDQGIIRAMGAKYKPNKDVIGDPHKTLFVARLNPKTREDTLEEVFSKYGIIKKLKLIRDIVTGFSRCYGFVEYEDDSSAELAFWKASKLEIDGCEIFVDHECERIFKGWVPRRLGGGLGGKKESGQLRFGGRDRPFRKPINYYMNSKQNFDRNEEDYSRQDSRSERTGHGYHEKERDRYQEKERVQYQDRWRDRNRERTRDSRSRARSKDRYQSDRDTGKPRKDSYERNKDDSRDRRRERSRGRRDYSRERKNHDSRERKRDRSKERKRNHSRERKREDGRREKQRESYRHSDRQTEGDRRDISVDNFIRKCSEAVKVESPHSNTESETQSNKDYSNQQMYSVSEQIMYSVPEQQMYNVSEQQENSKGFDDSVS